MEQAIKANVEMMDANNKPPSNVFLMRNLNVGKSERQIENIQIQNDLVCIVRTYSRLTSIPIGSTSKLQAYI